MLNNFLALVAAILISTAVAAQSGEQVYQTYCTGCHGADLQGSAVAKPLIKKTWDHGGDRASLIKTIRNGIPSTEMAQWSNILTAKEISAVADFILKAQKTSDKAKQPQKSLKVETKLYKLNIQRLVTKGLKSPWGIEFVDANRALITENTGGLRWMIKGKIDTQPIIGTPKTYAYDAYGGMMDLALDPDYSKNGWIYIAFSYNNENSTDKNAPGMTKVVRGKVKDHQWVEEQLLFKVHDSLRVVGGMRWGCRLLFDKQGYLYFSIGDMNRGDDSQVLSRPAGKVYRINPDGSIPKDNPLVGHPNELQAIYSWGNRNVQGLAQHPVTGVIYMSEHGPKGGDELNILKNGANYGWPVITYGIDYDGSIISNETHKEGMEQPVTYWTPSIAVSAIEFVNPKIFPLWKNNLIVSALAFQEIRRLVIDGDRVTEQEILLKGYGRVRDVKFGFDGALYVLTNAPDAVLRITL
jgi:glucose/arabinose dehydrogenase